MILDFALVHTVTVETFTGSGALGAVYAAGVPVACWVNESMHLVIDSKGAEVTSAAVVTAGLDSRALFTVGTRVTLPSGRKAHVITLGVGDSGPLNIGLDHVTVHLT